MSIEKLFSWSYFRLQNRAHAYVIAATFRIIGHIYMIAATFLIITGHTYVIAATF